MYRTMESTNSFAAVFFVALVVLGEVRSDPTRDMPRYK